MNYIRQLAVVVVRHPYLFGFHAPLLDQCCTNSCYLFLESGSETLTSVFISCILYLTHWHNFWSRAPCISWAPYCVFFCCFFLTKTLAGFQTATLFTLRTKHNLWLSTDTSYWEHFDQTALLLEYQMSDSAPNSASIQIQIWQRLESILRPLESRGTDCAADCLFSFYLLPLGVATGCKNVFAL